MGLEIIGAGFGRTGTRSLKDALEILGFGPCYHMTEVKKNTGHRHRWNEITHGRPADWDELFGSYRSAVDWPAAHFWRELADHYRGAKVVLTIRDPEGWYTSFSNTIARVIRTPVPPGASEEDHVHRETIHRMLTEQTFHGSPHDRKVAIAAFMARMETVAREIAPDRLLVYEIQQGWEPLCRFLNVPIPPDPFPKTNSTAEFLSQPPVDDPAANPRYP